MSQSWRSVAAIVLALFVVINVVSFVWFPFLPWFEQRQAGEEIVREEMDAQQALDDYRWFRQQYQDIQAQREIIANSYDERERFYEIHGKDPSQWSRTAETRHGRIEQRITGNQNQLETMVADYNARSQDATSSVFKCSLPYQVDERFAVTGPPGSGPAEQPVDKTIDGEPVEGEPRLRNSVTASQRKCREKLSSSNETQYTPRDRTRIARAPCWMWWRT